LVGSRFGQATPASHSLNDPNAIDGQLPALCTCIPKYCGVTDVDDVVALGAPPVETDVEVPTDEPELPQARRKATISQRSIVGRYCLLIPSG